MAILKKPGIVTVVELNFQVTLARCTFVHFQLLCCRMAYIWKIAPNWAGFMKKKLFFALHSSKPKKKNRSYTLFHRKCAHLLRSQLLRHYSTKNWQIRHMTGTTISFIDGSCNHNVGAAI